jgi:hypothetical protein
MQNLMRTHWRTGKPVKRIKRETAEAIMAVRTRSLRPGTYVTKLDAVSLVLDLMSLGYSGAWIPPLLRVRVLPGERPDNFALITTICKADSTCGAK